MELLAYKRTMRWLALFHSIRSRPPLLTHLAVESYKLSMATVLTEQPSRYPSDKMDIYRIALKEDLLAGGSEKSQSTNHYEGGDCEREAPTRCHKSRRRMFLMLVGLFLLLGIFLFAVSYSRYGFRECTTDTLGGLVKRAAGEGSNPNSNDSTFTHHKCICFIYRSMDHTEGKLLSRLFDDNICWSSFTLDLRGNAHCMVL